MKIYEKELDNKLRPTIEKTLNKAQSGFLKRRSAHEQVFTIKQISDKTYSLWPIY